ncbi:MAG: diacylglycerol kinase [Desulfobulbaceae bacterium]|nr:diacylglycerol kinase [Desulfobulbaceae bacterium]HIJ78162.1 diacylglycerol kinase [Deltaproteobacteria bacterium]
MQKNSGNGIKRLINAFGWSMAGLAAATKNEKAFQQELILCLLLGPVAILLGKNATEQALLVGALLLILIVEMLNSALEAVVDRIGPEQHELAGRAKDMGSAAVFLAMVNAAIFWALILLG